MSLNQMMIYAILIFAVYQILGKLWRKKHPKYDITFIAAEIGAGKTCYAAKLARKHIKKGWHVYTNDFVLGAGKIDVKMLETMCAPEKSLIILDETRACSKNKKVVLLQQN